MSKKSRKQKPRLHERKALAKKWLVVAGKASDFVTRLKRFAKRYPNLTRVILYVRVSDRKQARANSQAAQRERLLRAAKKYRLEVIDIIIDVKPAKRHSKRLALREAFAVAQQHDAFVLAYATNRLIRGQDHHSTKRPDAVPTREEFEELAALADGVPMVTLLDPDLPPSEVHSRMTKLAKKHRGNKGGRPRKDAAKPKPRQSSNTKARREFYMDEGVRELHRQGKAYREIEAIAAEWDSPFDPPRHSTIQGWIEREKRRCTTFSKRRTAS